MPTSECDMCGKKWERNGRSPSIMMRRLRSDKRSGLKKTLFSRKPDDFSDYDRMIICESCLGRATQQGWMEYKRFWD
jgi:hypothetical protein